MEPRSAPHSPRPARLRALVALAAVAPLAIALPAAAVDLEGTWYVLIHYKDSSTANPDADRWEDKVWKFEKKGSRLQWTEFPIVVFEDKTGRFGRVGRNERARLLHAWEPNEAQRAEIAAGPQVNSRGSKTKALRGSPQRGYRSTSQSRTASAFTVGYQESWQISSPLDVPTFTRDDSLGSETALATGGDDSVLSGRTLYEGVEVRDGGNLIVGSYARDESRQGTFQLIRAGDARGLESDGRTPNQKARERAAEQLQAAVQGQAYSEFQRKLGEDNLRALRATIGEDGITAIWEKYEHRLIAGDPRATVEIGDDLREAYAKSVGDKLAASLADGNAFFDADKAALDARSAAFVRDVRDTLGEEKVAALRAEYADAVAAGDADAQRALRAAVRDALVASLREDLSARLNAVDPSEPRESDR